ncbi:PDZ domain-containing protein [Planomicrobium soli]|nr:PDZ domain-containing protein [Planomicrobium soli]
MDVLLDIGRFFINPVFYIALIAAILLGYFRVKKERKEFRTRIVWGWTELGGLLKEGFLFAVGLSILIAGLGLVVPTEWLIALSIVTLILLISGLYQIGSFIYLSTAAVLLGWLMQKNDWAIDLGFFRFDGYSLSWNWLLPVALITGIVVLIEGWLVRKYGAASSSPRLEKSPRGMMAALYQTKRLWLIPVLFVVPGSLVESYAPYWPQLPIGESSFSFILFPLVFGFQNRARKTLPIYFFPRIGKFIMIAGGAVVLLSLGAFLWKPMALAALIVGTLAHLAITIYFTVKERQGNHAVTPQAVGVMIVDVLPDSPADKMGLIRGEVIRKVNGLTVTNESELYEAIQVNAAHCRLEVLDHNREVRLRQHVIFRHDHHRLGLIVVN